MSISSVIEPPDDGRRRGSRLAGENPKKMSHVVHFLLNLEREDNYGNSDAPLQGDYVLIGIDGTKRGDDIIEWYFNNLHRKGNRVIVAHAIETPVLLLTKENAESNKEIEKNKQEALYNRYKNTFRNHECDGSFYSTASRAGDMLLKISTERKISYIVTGSKAPSRFKRVTISSVTEYLMKYSLCPIIVAR